MKNKKGFTLIELLAIISILAIILLIAVPAISNVIETSRKNAFKDTALSVIKAAEFSYDLKKLENNVIEDITIDLGDKNDPNRGLIELKGEYPSGTVVINNGVVKVNITNGYFCATGTRDTLEIKKGDCEDDFPIVVSNADDECFIVEGNSIVFYSAGLDGYNCPTDLKIPNKINGVTITSVNFKNFPEFNHNQLTKLEIPEGISTVNFSPGTNINISNDAHVYLPNSLEYVNYYQFSMAANTVVENGFKYLTNIDGTTNKNIILEYQGENTDIIIPKETKIIYSNSFNNKNLMSVNFSNTNNLTQIGDFAFANNKLENVVIPPSVKYLSTNAFDNNKFNGIFVPNDQDRLLDDHGQLIIEEKNKIEDSTTGFVYLKKIDGTPDKRFLLGYNGTNTDIVIPEGVTQILPGALNSKNLTNVTFPSTLKYLERYAVAFNNLKQLNLPKGLISIGESAFTENKLEGTLTIPSTVTSINNSAFMHCGSENKFTGLIIDNANVIIGENAFSSNNGLTSIDLGNKTISIYNYAFAYLNLTNITIPNSVKYLSGFNDNQLTSINIPDSVQYLSGFSNNQLTSINIPNSVTVIGNQAFSNNQLTSINIPNSVTTIGYNAFSNNQLTSTNIPDSVTIIGNQAFSNNKLTSINIPNSVTSIDDGAFSNNNLTSINIPNSVKYLSGFDGNQLTSINIPDSVTSIGTWAFQSNQLTNITIPNSVISIHQNAFTNNKLTSVTIPESVINFLYYNIFNDNLLTEVIIEGDCTRFDSIWSRNIFGSFPLENKTCK